MNQKVPQIVCGFAAALLAASALVACDGDALSALDFSSTNSSSVENPAPISSSDKATPASSSSEEKKNESSSSVKPTSSSIHKYPSSSSASLWIQCKNGSVVQYPQTCPEYSSSSAATSSSSGAQSSSSYERCKHVTDVVCDQWPCHTCSQEGAESFDCATGKDLRCKNGEWHTPEEFCPNGRWTTYCDGLFFAEPVCCEDKSLKICKHITDIDYKTGENCVSQNGKTAVDCVTGDNFQCKNNKWEKVSCLNIKPDECKPGMGGCGYRLCQPDGIQEIADCENSVIYYCDGESWRVKETEDNQRCVQGELEYCDACYREGEFEGRYKCEGGKWRKYGMGDETCVHISNLKCERGMTGCGACDPIYDGTLAEDCETGFTYGCYNGYWGEVLVQRPMPCESKTINGSTCETEGSAEVVDGCAFVCNNGVYTYAPAPM